MGAATKTALLAVLASGVWIHAQSDAAPKKASPHPAGATPSVHVHSTPDNVVLGVFPSDRAPVARVASGAVVRIDTLSQRGATQQEDPVTFLGKFGVKPDEVLKDVKDLWAARAAKFLSIGRKV